MALREHFMLQSPKPQRTVVPGGRTYYPFYSGSGLVEFLLGKENVVGSNPITRSTICGTRPPEERQVVPRSKEVFLLARATAVLC